MLSVSSLFASASATDAIPTIPAETFEYSTSAWWLAVFFGAISLAFGYVAVKK